MTRNILFAALVASMLLVASAAKAQTEETGRSQQITIQGTGFFTRDSQGNGITQHSTDTGGLLLSYRYHFNRWLGADASYGYNRNTLQNLALGVPFDVQSNMHQATG